MISVPVMSLGIRSGVNWMRLKRERQRLGQGVDHQRLGQAGHADQQRVAAGQDGRQDPLDHLLLPHDAARHLGTEVLGGARQLGELFDVGRGGAGGGHSHSRSGCSVRYDGPCAKVTPRATSADGRSAGWRRRATAVGLADPGVGPDLVDPGDPCPSCW